MHSFHFVHVVHKWLVIVGGLSEDGEIKPINQSGFHLPQVDKKGNNMNNAAHFQNIHPINLTVAADSFLYEEVLFIGTNTTGWSHKRTR